MPELFSHSSGDLREHRKEQPLGIADLQYLLLQLSISSESANEMGVRGIFQRYTKEASDTDKSSRASMAAPERRGALAADGTAEPLMRLDEWLWFCREEQGEVDEERLTVIFREAATPPPRPEFEYINMANRKKDALVSTAGDARAKLSRRFSSMRSIFARYTSGL